MSALTHPLQCVSGKDHDRRLRGTVSIRGRTISNLRFADDIAGSAREEELAKLVKRLHKASTVYDMEISAEKTQLMTKNTTSINKEIKVNGRKLETIASCKYLCSLASVEGSKPEILFRTAQATAALTGWKLV